MSVPVHIPQLYTDVTDGEWRDHGEGRWGPLLRCNGGGHYATLGMQRSTVHGSSNAVLGRVVAKNNGSTPKDGYHGLGLSLRALKRVGGELIEVWNNNLIDSGNLDYWLTDLTDKWSTGSVVVQIPERYNPDFVDTWWVYKATEVGDTIEIDGIGLHDYHGRIYRTSLRNRIISNFTTRLLSRFLPSGRSANWPTRFIDNKIINLTKGQQMEIAVDGIFNEQYSTSSIQNEPRRAVTMIALKLLSLAGDDWSILCQVGTVQDRGLVEEDIIINAHKQIIASKAYTQYELYFVTIGADPSFNDSEASLGPPYVVDVDSLDIVVNITTQRETGNN